MIMESDQPPNTALDSFVFKLEHIFREDTSFDLAIGSYWSTTGGIQRRILAPKGKNYVWTKKVHM